MSYLGIALLGALSWTVTEYLLHRFRGHGGNASSAFAKEHLKHHARVDYFAPVSKKAAMAAPPLLFVGTASVLLGGWAAGMAFTGGFAKAYIGYELLHRRLHTHGPSGRWGLFLRRHHFAHHFEDARMNHGVTSAFWDRVFGTRRPVRKLQVPTHRAPVWLRLPPGQPLPRTLAENFELVDRRRRAG